MGLPQPSLPRFCCVCSTHGAGTQRHTAEQAAQPRCILTSRLPPSCTRCVTDVPPGTACGGGGGREAPASGLGGDPYFYSSGLTLFQTSWIKVDPSLFLKPALAQDQVSPSPGHRSPPGAGWRLLSSLPRPIRFEITKGRGKDSQNKALWG